MSKELLETLDALNNERPNVMQLKRKHFDMDKYGTATKKERLEWMRLNSERDRVDKYKTIAVSQTKAYYTILEKYAKMLDLRKEAAVVVAPSSSQP